MDRLETGSWGQIKFMKKQFTFQYGQIRNLIACEHTNRIC